MEEHWGLYRVSRQWLRDRRGFVTLAVGGEGERWVGGVGWGLGVVEWGGVEWRGGGGLVVWVSGEWKGGVNGGEMGEGGEGKVGMGVVRDGGFGG